MIKQNYQPNMVMLLAFLFTVVRHNVIITTSPQNAYPQYGICKIAIPDDNIDNMTFIWNAILQKHHCKNGIWKNGIVKMEFAKTALAKRGICKNGIVKMELTTLKLRVI